MHCLDPALATSEKTGKRHLIHLASVKDSSDIDFKEILSMIKRVSLKEGCVMFEMLAIVSPHACVKVVQEAC